MLMAVSQNVGVPLALAFGVAERTEFYEHLPQFREIATHDFRHALKRSKLSTTNSSSTQIVHARGFCEIAIAQTPSPGETDLRYSAFRTRLLCTKTQATCNGQSSD
jgi:hypothetical protein